MVSFRKKYKTSIPYFLVTTQTPESYSDFITAPKDLSYELFQFLAVCPIDLVQIFKPEQYYQAKCNEIEESCLVFNIVFEKDFTEHISVDMGEIIKVIILGNVSQYQELIEQISSLPNLYFTILNREVENKYQDQLSMNEKYFFSALGLTKLLLEDVLPSIDAGEHMQFNNGNISRSQDVLQAKQIPLFGGAHSNFFIECQTTGNYWKNDGKVSEYSDNYIEENSYQLMRDTVKGVDKHTRINIYLDQFKTLDIIYRQNHVPIRVTDIDSNLPSLILVLPFQNPQARRLSELYGIQGFKGIEVIHRLFKIEQNINYIFNFAVDDNKPGHKEIVNAQFEIVGKFIQPRLKYLDFIKYLHASFAFSPSARLPILGDSILKELSFLRPDSKNRLVGKSLNKTILRFGNRLTELVFNKKMEEYIAQRDSQIITISDLPMEWMMIKGLPLAYTHDICRIPETGLKSPLSVFALNSFYLYSVPEDILDRTLVIMGSPEDEPFYESINNLAIEHCQRLGISYKRVFSVNEFISTVKEFEPELLIIDCHGGYDQETLSSYLEVNGEKLSHEHIVNNSLHAPLVFLSACATSPNYGYVHSIANAFFNTGSFSVTSTYLPINIDNGTNTYLRLLWHLKARANDGNFENWLAYVSMSIRTSIFNVIIREILKKIEKLPPGKRKIPQKMIDELDAIKDSLLVFSKRRQTFERMQQLLNNLSPDFRVSIENIVRENLLYTHLGRPDLIKFDSWVKRKKAKTEELFKNQFAADNQ